MDQVNRPHLLGDAAPHSNTALPAYKHAAFISYSRTNEVFASRLEQALERYKPPRGLNLPHRRLDIFRDNEDFTAGEYHQNLDKNLQESAKLIVICSPEARRSEYVNEEIRNFVRIRGVDHIIPVLFSGIPNNAVEPGREEEMAFPEALCEAMRMPLAVNYLGFNPATDKIDGVKFSTAWHMTLANILGVDRAEIEQRNRRRRARARRIAFGVVGVAIIVLSGLLIWALTLRGEAQRQQRYAQMQREMVEREATRNEELLYVSDINIARQMYRLGNHARARDLIEAYLKKGQKLRGFEWYYFMGQLHKERTTLETQGSPVASVAFSPDGKTLACGRLDGRLQFWDVASNKEEANVEWHSGPILGVAFSPDGKIVATTGGQVKLWDVASRKGLTELRGHQNIAEAVVFSPDGEMIATGSQDTTIKLWDVASGKELATLAGHTAEVHDVAFSPDGATLASGSGDNTVKLWDIASRRERATLKQFMGIILAVAFSPDGKALAVGGAATAGMKQNQFKVWDVTLRRELAGLTGHTGDITDLAYSSDGQTLFSVSSDGTVKLWNAAYFTELGTLEGHRGNIADVAVSPDSKTLATASDDGCVKLWDVASPKRWSGSGLHITSAGGMSFSPDSQKLATVGARQSVKPAGVLDNEVTLWDVATHTERHTYTLEGVQAITFSPDGNILATGTYNNTVNLWDLAGLKWLAKFQEYASGITAVAFSPDGKALASASKDTTATLWSIGFHKEMVYHDESVTFTGQRLATFSGHQEGITAVAFSPDGKTLATASNDRTVKLWDLDSFKELATLKGHKGGVNALAFSPDGKTLATGSSDSTVRLWEVTSRQELSSLEGHTKSVNALAFSPDGRTLASGSSDTTIKLWHVASRKELITLEEHKADIVALAFSPDGKALASSSANRMLFLWHAPLTSDADIEFQLHGWR